MQHATNALGAPLGIQHAKSGQRTFTAELNSFYDEIIACISAADSILIFGPGEAKGELKKRLDGKNLGDRVAGVETVDNMTDPQIAAKVRLYFAG